MQFNCCFGKLIALESFSLPDGPDSHSSCNRKGSVAKRKAEISRRACSTPADSALIGHFSAAYRLWRCITLSAILTSKRGLATADIHQNIRAPHQDEGRK
jgi:hypothetical protein